MMPPNSSLLGDLIKTIAWLVVTTKQLLDTERYLMAMSDLAWKTITESWELICPERIVEDIIRFESALGAIIAAEMAYVEDYDLRIGHWKTMHQLVCSGVVRRSEKAAQRQRQRRGGAGGGNGLTCEDHS